MKKLLASFSFLLTLLSVAPIFAADESPLASDATYDLEAHWHRGYGNQSAENRVLEIKLASDGYYQLFIIDKDSATFNEVQITDTPHHKYNAGWGVYFDKFVFNAASSPAMRSISDGTWSVVYAQERGTGSNCSSGCDIYLKLIGNDTTGASSSSYPDLQLTDTDMSIGYNLDPDMNFGYHGKGGEIVYVRHNDTSANGHSTIHYLKFDSQNFSLSLVGDKNLTYRYSDNCTPQGIDAEGDALYPKWIDGSNVAFTFKFTNGGSGILMNNDNWQVATVYKEETETDDGVVNGNDYYYSCADNSMGAYNSSFHFVTDSRFDHFRPMPTWSSIETGTGYEHHGLVYHREDSSGVSTLAGSRIYIVTDSTSNYWYQVYTSSLEKVLSDSTYNRLNPVFAPHNFLSSTSSASPELWIAYERQDNDATNTAQIYGTKVELPQIKLVKAMPPIVVAPHHDWVEKFPGIEIEPYEPAGTGITITPPTGGFSFNNGGYAVKEDKFPFITTTSVVDWGIVKGAKKAEKKWELYVDGVLYGLTEYKSTRISTLREQMLAEFELDPSRFYQTKVEFKDKTVTFVTPVPLGESFTKRNTPNGLILILEEKKSGDSSKNWKFPFIRSAYAATYSSTLSSSLAKFGPPATDSEVRWTDCFDSRYPEFAELLNTSDGTTIAVDTPNDLVYVKIVDTDYQVTHLFDLPNPVVEGECGEPTEPDPKEPDPKDPVEPEEDCESLGYTVYNSTMSGEMSDADGDGYADGDTDHDGMADKCDACPDIAPYWDGKPFTDDDGNETCVEQSDCGCSSCCGCSGDITVTATASVGDITVTGGDTIVSISYTGGSTTTSGGTTSGVDPAIITELGIAAAEGTPEGDAIFTGSSCGCSFNTPTSVVQVIQQMFWLMCFGIPIFLKRKSLSKSK